VSTPQLTVRIKWHGRALTTLVGASAGPATRAAAEPIFARSQVYVPKDTMALHDSGRISTPFGKRTIISYNTPYAVRQHEDTRLRHQPPTRAKYLETALREKRDDALRIMATEIGNRTGMRTLRTGRRTL